MRRRGRSNIVSGRHFNPLTSPYGLQHPLDAAIGPHSMETSTQKNDAPAFFAQAGSN
jgi:hypothetical protein